MKTYAQPSKPVKSKPKLVKLDNKKTPLNLFTRLCEHFDYTYILESAGGHEKLAEYSFIGFEPQLVVNVKDGNVEINNMAKNNVIRMVVDDPLPLVKKIVGGINTTQNNFRFIGGAVGYISYDAVRYWERLPRIAVDDFKFPDLHMAVYNDGVVFNHRTGEVFYYYFNENRLKEVEAVANEDYSFEVFSYSGLRTNIKKENFEKNVLKAKDYIALGDIFQVVLSRRYEFNFKGSLIPFYRVLRTINPSPYMFFLKMQNHQIVGSSPEMLVRVENGFVETFPIAGTRPRIKNDMEKDKILAQELTQDPKEQAEHIMLVDLARNDIGRVSEFGSVHV
ncbi:MAG: anthranilate synthase component I family protein, partial [Candidatus Bathyarchaeota archaeon]|nr:anthranilate synthase component I family protein [Candidatus Bathyarchaeota archaeon]